MSEEKKPAKWEKLEWIIQSYDLNLGLKKSIGICFSKSAWHKIALGYGNLIIGADEISLGNFELPLANIISFEKDKKYNLIIFHCTDEKHYLLWAFTRSSNVRKVETGKVLLILSEKIKPYKIIRISKGKDIIKNLPKLYKEINLDEVSSKVGLEKSETVNIIENLVLNEGFKAEIRGNMLKLRKEPEAVVSPPGYMSETSPIQRSEKREGMLVFVSYATKDAELYKIPELARKLEEYKEIGEVLYWQEDMHDSIIEYMNDNLGRCNGVLLFCSPNALDSVPVKKEWMAAEALKKPIIPIFLKPEHIPPLLSDRLGFEFDNFDLQKNVREIHELLLKKKLS